MAEEQKTGVDNPRGPETLAGFGETDLAGEGEQGQIINEEGGNNNPRSRYHAP